jgi:hypothetical protein
MVVARKITQWSFSRYKDYCQCPRLAFYKHVEKRKLPPSPAMDRGTAIHKAAEDYLKGLRRTVAPELKHFKDKLKELKKLGASAEGEMALTKAYKPTGWFNPDVWVRIKTDVIAVLEGGVELLIGDWKTGRKYDDHEEQLGLYAMGGFVLNPLVKKVRAEDWYTDIAPSDKGGNVLSHTFAVKDFKVLQKTWEKNTKAMLNDTKFAPLPSNKCRYCPFSKAHGGPCEF